jgi:hypothetical protein
VALSPTVCLHHDTGCPRLRSNPAAAPAPSNGWVSDLARELLCSGMLFPSLRNSHIDMLGGPGRGA